ncbi:hypothetical protein FM117_07270 [Micrococcus luteus Mu201]|nr:hypothetical protein FM117_07270 [Micrococcus luteus Mu201]
MLVDIARRGEWTGLHGASSSGQGPRARRIIKKTLPTNREV